MQRKCLLQLLLVQRRPLWGRWLLLLLLLARWRPLLGQVAPSITFACAAATAPGARGSFYYFCLCGGDRSWGRWLLLLLLLVPRRPLLGQVAPSITFACAAATGPRHLPPSSTFACAATGSGAGGSFYSTFACAAATGPGAGGSF